jgi:ABC-type branched-subunit amino acid transport system ATPase component
VENLSLPFGGLSALESVSLGVKSGSITALIGPNGAGKTSLFNVISGIYKPSAGRVLFAGADITGRKTHAIVRSGIARTFQNIRLFPSLSCMENVMCGPNVHASMGIWPAIFRLPALGGRKRRILEIAAWRLRQVGLWDSRDELAKNLPYGKQRLLEIARALATSPKLLVLDEPSSGLNDRESTELMDCSVRSGRGDNPPADRTRHERGDGHFRRGRGPGGRRAHRLRLAVDDLPPPAVVEAYLGGAE